MYPDLEQIRARILQFIPAAQVTIVNNTGAAEQHSLLLDNAHARTIAAFLRDDADLRLDYCSNVTGVDWLDKEVTETKKVAEQQADGTEKVVEQKTKRIEPGYLEAVYHLYSIEKKSPAAIVIRLRTANRTDNVTVPSLTPVWRSCELQEREVFDLYGIVFENHPDLRRLLMWDEFKDHPMRKDYVSPDDYEWEPTPHDEVLTRAMQHYPQEEASRGDTEGAEK
ncbi:MAG: NADH-quinone oxidoreductase subunit C [Puniceicoccales bacterium]|jgi:NADH-quinone oxidoreductase subunit C|nr:NADH-quinone oxidoreductase subunit C [Puniceicoccales bacterium]